MPLAEPPIVTNNAIHPVHAPSDFDGQLPGEEAAPPVNWKALRLLLLWGGTVLLASFFGGWIVTHNARPLPQGPFNNQPEKAVPLMVHVAGRVLHPGVYALSYDARVVDAVSKAGGALPDANLDAVNLAAWVEDAQKIEIPSRTTAAAPPPPEPTLAPIPAATLPTPEESTVPPPLPAPKPAASKSKRTHLPAAQRPLPGGIPRAITPSGKASKKASPDYLRNHQLNLNTATRDQLVLLPGIGEKMADRILVYRSKSGPLKSVEDLGNVKGIGVKKLDKLRPLVMVPAAANAPKPAEPAPAPPAR